MSDNLTVALVAAGVVLLVAVLAQGVWQARRASPKKAEPGNSRFEPREPGMGDTDTADAPWTVVKSDDKKRARLNTMQHFLASLDYPNKDRSLVRGPDPLIVGSTAHVIGRDEHILGKSLPPEKRRGGS